MEDLWTVFCVESQCNEKKCSSGSCIKNSIIILLDLLLILLILLLILTRKPSPRKTQVSILQMISAISNGCLGLVYFGLGVWKLVERVFPLYLWLVVLFQGLTWFFC
ncbi:hypothetical protein ACHQM5_019636 [Ranunculus cassubicifolius]